MRLSPNQYKKAFLVSETATEILAQLKQMEESPLYATKTFYSPGNDGDISFSNKHFTYISTHPNIQPREYMANLRLMTKIH